MATTKPTLDTLLFVDTNILLDFYRMQNTDISTKLLVQLEACKDRLILSTQVEMEYKKNRQKVILDTLKNFSSPDSSKPIVPAILRDLKAVEMMEKSRKNIVLNKKKIEDRIQKLLGNPAVHDPVYKVLQKLFKHESTFNLTRQKKERFEIRDLAKKRFLLGYPPRKSDDTSIGDAVNWEWIVRCSTESKKHVVIVTRDGDYGAFYDKRCYLNDFLKLEFSDRTNQQRKIVLTNKLSEGLKIVHANITQEMMDVEEKAMRAELNHFDLTDVVFPEDVNIFNIPAHLQAASRLADSKIHRHVQEIGDAFRAVDTALRSHQRAKSG